MSFAITSATGFVTEDAEILIPGIAILIDATFGAFAVAGKILQRRDSAFSTVEIEIIDARIIDAMKVGGVGGISAGSTIKVAATSAASGTEVLFAGYITGQTFRASSTGGETKEESVIVRCVDYRFDLYREVIIGQIGRQADKTSGAEADSGGPYGLGLGWFSGLPCVFNDRTFIKNAESTWAKAGSTTQHGNAREVSDALGGEVPLSKCFDGNYLALNIRKDKEKAPTGRNLAWSAWDMINYVMSYCYAPPFSKGSIVGTLIQPILVSKSRIILGPPNGMDTYFPVEVDIQGLRGTDAITKICAAVGYSWTLEPSSGASVLVVWQTGSVGPTKIEFFTGTGGSGLPKGLYRTLTKPLAFPSITKTKWNVSNLDITIDYTQVVGVVIGTTANIKSQAVFMLRKGWTGVAFFDFIKAALIAPTVPQSGYFGREGSKLVFSDKGASDGKTLRYFVRMLNDNMVSLRLERSANSEYTDHTIQDQLYSIFRRWLIDETGLLDDMAGAPRKPANLTKGGLHEVNGSTYMVKPRPFESNNISTTKSGDKSHPRTYFPKFSPGQDAFIVPTSWTESNKLNPKEIEDGHNEADVKGGKSFYPYGPKKGSVKILDKAAGIFLEGGNLELSNMTIDPNTNSITIFPPIILATMEHDQAAMIVSEYIAAIGKLAPGRRWVDGKRFKVDNVYAVETKSFTTEEQVKGGVAFVETEAMSPMPEYSVNELAKLSAEITAKSGFYTAPKVTMSVTVPTITTAYKLSYQVTGIFGKLSLAPGGSIVGIEYDLLNLNTIISVESEETNPNLQISDAVTTGD